MVAKKVARQHGKRVIELHGPRVMGHVIGMGLAVRQVCSDGKELQRTQKGRNNPEHPELGFRDVQAELEQVEDRTHDHELTYCSVAPHE